MPLQISHSICISDNETCLTYSQVQAAILFARANGSISACTASKSTGSRSKWTIRNSAYFACTVVTTIGRNGEVSITSKGGNESRCRTYAGPLITFYHHISFNIEAARLGVKLMVLLCNSTSKHFEISQGNGSGCLSNCWAIDQL